MHDAPEHDTAETTRGWPWLLAALLLLGWRSWEPLGRDQHIFTLLGRELWHGSLPYRDLFEHKPPGVLAIYALAAGLDGGAGWGIGLLDTLAAGLTAALLAATLRRAGAPGAAVWAGAIYLLTSRSPVFGSWWGVGQPEPFQDLGVALALLAGVRGAWLTAGIALHGVMLLKFTYGGLVPLWLLWAGRAGSARLLVGLLGPLVPLLAVTGATGTLRPMFDAVIGFNLRHGQVEATPWDRFGAKLWRGVTHIAALAPAPALLGPAALLHRPPAGRLPRWLVPGVLGAAALQLLVQRKLWLWHWEPLVLPLSLLAALSLAALAARARPIAWVVGVLLLAPSAWFGALDATRALKPGAPDEVLARFEWGQGDFSALEVAKVGRALKARAAPDDRLLVWGFDPGVYLASGLRPGTRWIYDYPLNVGLEGAAREAAVDEVLRQLPGIRWWVVFSADVNALEATDSATQLAAEPRLSAALAADYRLVDTIGDARVFERVSAPPDRSPP